MSIDIMIKHNLDIKDRFLTTDNYESKTDLNYDVELSDKIVTYYNGSVWRIIPINTMLIYHVLHDYYTEINQESNVEKKQIITIAVCPFTLMTAVFEGTFYPSEYKLNDSLLLTNNSGVMVSILTGQINNDEKCSDCTDKISRHASGIKIFRNALSDHPDCQYVLAKNLTKPILNPNYYTTNIDNKQNIHSMTLVRIIQYTSSIDMSHKYTVLIGHDANSQNASGYDMEKSGFNKYIDTNKDKIEEKNGFIIPCMFMAINDLIPNAKIIYL